MSAVFHSDHQRLDERSLALHAAVADKLQPGPSLVGRANANLSRWRATLNGAWLDESRIRTLIDLDFTQNAQMT